MACRLAAVLGAALLAAATAWPATAEKAPGFVEKTLHTSDIQYRFTLSPDAKAMSVLFDNLAVSIAPGGAPVGIRTFPMSIPVSDAKDGALLHIDARGACVASEGAKCNVILWVNGQTKALDVPSTGASFTGSADFKLSDAPAYQALVVLMAERDAKLADLSANLSLDSLDVTISAPPADTEKK